MLELMFCSLLTILPDYLYRRYGQGKRIGKEITFYSVWFELRWGITGCLILTVALITTVFYNHPSTTSATLFFRTVPILPETNGRVAEIFIGNSGPITKGAPIFRLDNSKQEAAVETARRKIVEVDAQMALARVDVTKAEGQTQGSPEQSPTNRGRTGNQARTIQAQSRQRSLPRDRAAPGTCDGPAGRNRCRRRREAEVSKSGLSTLLPAEKASAEAALNQAQVDLDKTVVRAGVNGRVEQFFLRVGDIVNPLMRPAGILIPEGAGQHGLQAGFGQIEAQIMKPGMIAEVTCVSKPFTVIPMVVTSVQDYIAAGQFRGGEQLIDAQQVARPGTLLVFLEPLYQGRSRWRDAGQQLHRQRLFQQSRHHCCKRHRHLAGHHASRRGRPRPWCTP